MQRITSPVSYFTSTAAGKRSRPITESGHQSALVIDGPALLTEYRVAPTVTDGGISSPVKAVPIVRL
jgi:hypothetical protein